MEGDLERDLEGDLEGDSKGDFRGDFNRIWKGTCCQAQVRSRSGLVRVWFSIQPKFNSFELDSEVGRLVGGHSWKKDKEISPRSLEDR